MSTEAIHQKVYGPCGEHTWKIQGGGTPMYTVLSDLPRSKWSNFKNHP